MLDLSDIHEFMLALGRSVGAEIASPWFYLQLGLMLAGAGIALPLPPGYGPASIPLRW